ncbi:TetR/AcrR family transcriptional regulator [Jongsikchunia kroppenstedtii]|uniref:TetR/AcrR family transcriptional regulator n=1 Tax=Jongsikchunia kroppenstedtii TaxID=1121721 RepID=UPI000362A00D|nr:TetR family transcriptional regulator [Jongsikchunia kroppenstedtii]
MRSTASPRQGTSGDLTTRARIRDAAITVFGEQGFTAGVRAVATAAGVSPGLVNHHFGSKEGLRTECEAYVIERIRVVKTESLTRPSAAGLLRQLAEVEEYAPFIAYIIRSYQAGGPLGRSMFEHMVGVTERYLADGVAAGTLRPSRDPAARARYLSMQSLGSTLLFLQMRADQDGPVDWARVVRELTDETMFPALELYTEGLFIDSTFLDTMIQQRAETASDTINHETTDQEDR